MGFVGCGGLDVFVGVECGIVIVGDFDVFEECVFVGGEVVFEG